MAPIRGWREALALGSGARLVLSLAGVLLIGSASLVASGVAGARPPHGGPRCPWVSSGAPVAKRVAELLRQLTLANEITLVEGRGNPAKYEFYMPGIPRLCIPALGEEDGPNGVGDGLKGVTELPAGIALAASWDPSLARRYGAVIGAEERAKGAAVNLGPTINIDRDPRWGRTFEAYSEDPFLDARLAVSEISGVQSQGVMAEVKHFAVYNQETNRNLPSDDAVVSQRALNEIYLPAFQAAVQQGDAAAVMCSYATVNGAYACQNRGLETGVLALRWGFSGFVTSDYGALHATSGALDGTDQEQPERTYFGEALLRAVRDGRIPRAALNTMVSRLLGQMFRFRLFNRGPSGSVSAVATSAAHRAVATAVADEGAVLLKNSGDTLPISRAGAGRVVVIGPAASVAPVYGGGGSAAVIPSSTVTPLQGLRAGAGAGTVVSYVQGLPADSALPSVPRADLSPAYFGTSAGHGYAGSLRPPESGTYVLALTNHCGCYAPTYLSLDGRELLANPGTAPSATYSAAVSLVAGHRYRLRIYGGVGSGGNGGGVSSALG
ncbi:MAG TPA: glycoside hydrolase family 3 N-terminal domain-containing protein, partial [Solirubrobacteraceae bacterium]|nr:glycoside hydrolase family 3 N-terminal domain-containing protein [Solirubrobacteraceae bacterium]